MLKQRRFGSFDVEPEEEARIETEVQQSSVELRASSRLTALSERCYLALESLSRYILLIVSFSLFLLIAAASSDVKIRYFLDTDIKKSAVIVFSELALTFVIGHIATLSQYATQNFFFIEKIFDSFDGKISGANLVSLDRFFGLMFTGLGIFNPLTGFYLNYLPLERRQTRNVFLLTYYAVDQFGTAMVNIVLKSVRVVIGNFRSLTIVVILSAPVCVTVWQSVAGLVQLACSRISVRGGSLPTLCQSRRVIPNFQHEALPIFVELALCVPLIILLLLAANNLATLLTRSGIVFSKLTGTKAWPSVVNFTYFLAVTSAVTAAAIAGWQNYMPGSEIFSLNGVARHLFKEAMPAFGWK